MLHIRICLPRHAMLLLLFNFTSSYLQPGTAACT